MSQAPVPLRIRLPFHTEEEFIERYGANVAAGGVFVATRAPKPEGTFVAFEFVLADGARLLRGEGVVQKVQGPESGSPGMTLRFRRLDARTKALVDRMVALRQGLVDAQPPGSTTASATSEPPAPRPARAKVSDDVVLGVDLGTTNTRAALFVDGAAHLVPVGRDGRATALPSVVAVDEKGRYLVGARAKALVLADPQNTVFGAKRLLGRRARSKRVQEIAKSFPYALAADESGDAAVSFRGRIVPLPEVFGLLLEEVKNAAQEWAGRPIGRAVLCVPAYFTDHQRSAMTTAGERAGLHVLRILNEPSAVALAFGYGRGLARKRILVYDLGGGTFDASVVAVTGDDLEVVTTGGDNFLGGLDFDVRIADHVTGLLPSEERATLSASRHAVQRVRDAAEQAKISLSEAEHAPVLVPVAGNHADGSPFDVRTELSRQTLESLTQDLVQRTVEVTQEVLRAGSLTPQHLDEVLLVGGQSRAPLVRRQLETAVGRPMRSDIDPQGAVALGAAIYGHTLSQQERGKAGASLSEVLSAPIGVATQSGALRRVFDRNTRLPAQKTVVMPARAGQTLALAIFQGSEPRADDNEYLGVLQVTPEKDGELTVRFSVDADARLHLAATGPAGKHVEARLATQDASDEVRAALFDAAPLPDEPVSENPTPSGILRGIRKLFGRSAT